MRRQHYHSLDVFTDRAFGGNPLAVFLEADGLSDEMMQAIARELNLSETTFVSPPHDPKNDFRVRIFTPASELPMAGHPTIGTAFTLARAGLIKRGAEPTMITFEEGVGPVPVSLSWKDDAPDFIEMRQPLPQFGPRFHDLAAMAEMLSLDVGAIRETHLPLEVISCGVPFLFVPVNGLAAMRRIRFRLDVMERVLRDFAAQDVYVFTMETERSGSEVHGRMFAPAHGIAEDPATGSANGPLGCYLVRHGVLASEGERKFISEQGIEMRRPSFLHVVIAHAGKEITAVKVGGQCRAMGGGYLDLAEL